MTNVTDKKVSTSIDVSQVIPQRKVRDFVIVLLLELRTIPNDRNRDEQICEHHGTKRESFIHLTRCKQLSQTIDFIIIICSAGYNLNITSHTLKCRRFANNHTSKKYNNQQPSFVLQLQFIGYKVKWRQNKSRLMNH